MDNWSSWVWTRAFVHSVPQSWLYIGSNFWEEDDVAWRFVPFNSYKKKEGGDMECIITSLDELDQVTGCPLTIVHSRPQT
jgi:hypothetical protein